MTPPRFVSFAGRIYYYFFMVIEDDGQSQLGSYGVGRGKWCRWPRTLMATVRRHSIVANNAGSPSRRQRDRVTAGGKCRRIEDDSFLRSRICGVKGALFALGAAGVESERDGDTLWLIWSGCIRRQRTEKKPQSPISFWGLPSSLWADITST